MKSSTKVGYVAGIAIRIHVTFPVLLLWVALIRFLERRLWIDAVTGVAFTSALFGFVILHELGHAMMARRFGLRTCEITLLPIGGLARLERLPAQPLHELLIALAGPVVNSALALALFSILTSVGIPTGLETGVLEKNLLARLAWMNAGLAGLNLIPAFPLDGGRVFRALLALKMKGGRATNIAAIVGRIFAVLLGVLGLLGNPLLVLVAVFVWLGAIEEARAIHLRQALATATVGKVMLKEFHVLAPEDSLQRAVDLVRASGQRYFPVAAGDRLVGLLGWSELLAGFARAGPSGRVADQMQLRFGVAQPTENADRVLERARDDEVQVVVVVQNEKIAGLLTVENVSATVLLQAAIDRHARTTARTAG